VLAPRRWLLPFDFFMHQYEYDYGDKMITKAREEQERAHLCFNIVWTRCSEKSVKWKAWFMMAWCRAERESRLAFQDQKQPRSQYVEATGALRNSYSLCTQIFESQPTNLRKSRRRAACTFNIAMIGFECTRLQRLQ